MVGRTDALDDELAGTLRARGQRVTSQRLVIHRLLRNRNDHLTAEGVLAEVGETLPGMSLPTVYATLELFEALGLVRRVNAGGAVLFDSRTDAHHHTVCRQCGAVRDLDVLVDTHAARDAASSKGFWPLGSDLLITGVCANCQQSSGE
jgi:Fur family ferric uptake transcriptional regulator/Fur family peroxide stress response transcriptional regulator